MPAAKRVLLGVPVLMLVALLVVAACGGGGGPESQTFAIRVTGGRPAGGVATLRVRQGDTVTLNVTSDTKGQVHLHGYDIEKEMTPGATTTMTLTANATGRFLIELEETEAQLAFLEVLPR